MYSKEDYQKDRDLIRQYDGVKFEFPRTDPTGNKANRSKVNLLYRIPHLDGLYIESGAYGDVFGVCYNENEYNLANVKKAVDEHEKHRTILKQVEAAIQRVKKYESEHPAAPGTGAGERWSNKGYASYNKKTLSVKIGKDFRTVEGYLKDNNSLLNQKIVDTKESDTETLYLLAKRSIKTLREHYSRGKHKKDF